ncbi:MAG: hypothetical protein ABIN89_05480 [Chitinophagaceae bacterium]
MVFDYVVTLKNERGKYINTISLLLCLMSAAFFLIQQIKTGKHSFIFLISFCLITGGLIWNRYIVTKKRKPVFYSRILLVAGVTWFAMPFLSWTGLPLILLALLEKQARFTLEIGVTKDRIVFNSLFKRKFYWTDFNNVILKDNILTLDFKNNRLFQKETIDETGNVEEEEFNEYCRNQLKGSDLN